MKRLFKIGNFQFILAWYDIWVGAYWDIGHRTLYICPLPMIVLRFQFKGKQNESLHRKDRPAHPENGYVSRILKKRYEDCTDPEKEIQRIYR